MSLAQITGLPLSAARWSARHPRRAITAWLVMIAAAVALAAIVPTHQVEEADYRVGESGRAAELLEDAGLDEPPTERVLVTAAPGTHDVTEAAAAAAETATKMKGLDGVAAVGDPLPSEAGDAMLVPIELESDDVDTSPLLAATARVQAAHPDLIVEQAGDVTVNEGIDERVEEDLRSAEVISLPLTLLLMLLTFGALIAAGLPVLLAASSVAATIGISAPISYLVPAEPTVGSMIVLIGMAVGVDYSLFFLKRERLERAAGRTTLDAVEIAAATSGHSILVSGGAVIASLAALFVLTDVTFNSLATGSILVVAVAVLGSMTVLPALQALLGHRVDRPRIPLIWRLNRRAGANNLSSRLLGPVVRHPIAALTLASIATVALALPALGMKTHEETIETLPHNIPAVETLRAIIAAYPTQGTHAQVVVTGANSAESRAQLKELLSVASSFDDFDTHGAQVMTSADSSTSTLMLPMPYEAADERATTAIERLRHQLVPAVLGDVERDGAEVAVGGDAAWAMDQTAKQDRRMPYLLALVLGLSMVIMVVAFRSVVIGLLTTILNLASVGVAFGVLVIVFQSGAGEDLLNFDNQGFVIDWIPTFVLVVLIGLSMDYHVFVLSRVRELIDAGLSPTKAVHRGITETAGVVTSAAAVMVSVFAIFATLSLTEMKMLGVGLASAILLDATLIRLVVLPAALVLLGTRAWPRSKKTEQVSSDEPSPGADTPELVLTGRA